MKLLAAILTATLATAAAAWEPNKSPWVHPPKQPCAYLWFDMFKPTTTLQRIERRCGTHPVCRQFDKNVSLDMQGGLIRKFGFNSETECLAAHEPDPKKRCRRARKALLRSDEKVPRRRVDIACGRGAFCQAFTTARSLDDPAIAMRLLDLYGFNNETECVAKMPPSPLPSTVKRPNNSKNANNECEKAKERFYWSAARMSRETIDAACGTGQFCGLFDPEATDDDDMARVVRNIYGFHTENECLYKQLPSTHSDCSRAKMYMLSSERPVSAKRVDRACGAGTFCRLFKPGGFVGTSSIPYFTRIYGFRSQGECLNSRPIKKIRTSCEDARAAFLVSKKRIDHRDVDGPCGSGTFCYSFDAKKVGQKQVSFLEHVYGYINVQDCINGEYSRKLKEAAKEMDGVAGTQKNRESLERREE